MHSFNASKSLPPAQGIPTGRCRSHTIRASLIMMAVACVVPAWLGMLALIQAIYHREYQRDVGGQRWYSALPANSPHSPIA